MLNYHGYLLHVSVWWSKYELTWYQNKHTASCHKHSTHRNGSKKEKNKVLRMQTQGLTDEEEVWRSKKIMPMIEDHRAVYTCRGFCCLVNQRYSCWKCMLRNTPGIVIPSSHNNHLLPWSWENLAMGWEILNVLQNCGNRERRTKPSTALGFFLFCFLLLLLKVERYNICSLSSSCNVHLTFKHCHVVQHHVSNFSFFLFTLFWGNPTFGKVQQVWKPRLLADEFRVIRSVRYMETENKTWTSGLRKCRKRHGR